MLAIAVVFSMISQLINPGLLAGMLGIGCYKSDPREARRSGLSD